MPIAIGNIAETYNIRGDFGQGIAKGLTRRIQIQWLGVKGVAYTDVGDLLAQLRALLPASGDTLVVGGYGTLLLVDVQINVSKPHLAQCDLVYGLAEANTDLLEGESGLTETTTQVDNDGTPLLVEHKKETQVATMRRRLITDTLVYSTVLSVADANTVRLVYAGAVNNAAWRGGAAGLWLCSSVRFRPIDVSSSPPLWRVVFRFDLVVGGWAEDAFYVDPETGRPPDGLVAGDPGDTPTPGLLQSVSFDPEEDFSQILSAT